MAIPKYYTEAADAKWREWSGGNVDGRGLKKRDHAAVTINGVTVHALAFDTGEEWDCIQGWRPEPNAEPNSEMTQVPQINGDTAREPEEVIEERRPDDTAERAQAYAMRVWSGQSDSVGRSERVRRIKAALEGQNLPFDGVRLPGDLMDADEWTDEDAAPVSWTTQLPKPEGIV